MGSAILTVWAESKSRMGTLFTPWTHKQLRSQCCLSEWFISPVSWQGLSLSRAVTLSWSDTPLLATCACSWTLCKHVSLNAKARAPFAKNEMMQVKAKSFFIHVLNQIYRETSIFSGGSNTYNTIGPFLSIWVQSIKVGGCVFNQSCLPTTASNDYWFAVIASSSPHSFLISSVILVSFMNKLGGAVYAPWSILFEVTLSLQALRHIIAIRGRANFMIVLQFALWVKD